MSLLHRLAIPAHWPPHRVFLLDGLGAGVSLGMTVVVLWLQPWFGMPAAIVHVLVPLTAVFMANSLVWWLLRPRRWRLLLGLIAAANLGYAGLILTLLVMQRDVLTALGVAYFASEALVLVGVAVMELRFARCR
jgi:hypothetical protein